MSEITPLGLCTDNLVTIIQPSSTVECMFGEGNGCCGCDVKPTLASFDVSGTSFSSPQSIVLPINTTTPAIITGAVRLDPSGSVGPATIDLAIPSASWYSTVFVPAGTSTIISIPFSVPCSTNSLTMSVTTAAPITSYTVPYTVLTL